MNGLKEAVVDIAPIDKVQQGRPQTLAQNPAFAGRGVGEVYVLGDAPQHVELHVQLGRPVLGLPSEQGPGHLRQATQEAAVDRRGDARKGVQPGRMRQGLDLPGHRFENRPQEFRIEHVPGRFAHRPQRGPRDSQGALHVLQSCGLLQRAQTGKDRVEEMQ